MHFISINGASMEETMEKSCDETAWQAHGPVIVNEIQLGGAKNGTRANMEKLYNHNTNTVWKQKKWFYYGFRSKNTLRSSKKGIAAMLNFFPSIQFSILGSVYFNIWYP